jgi:hypothetical protein
MVALAINLFKRDYAGLWIGVKLHLLTVLDAFAFPPAIIGLEFGNLRVAGLENFSSTCWAGIQSGPG